MVLAGRRLVVGSTRRTKTASSSSALALPPQHPPLLFAAARRASFRNSSSNSSSNNSGSGDESSTPEVEAGPSTGTADDDDTTPSTSTFVFPWRHEPLPLPRLIEGTIEHASKGQLLTSTDMTPGNTTMNALATAYMFLNVPWYQCFPWFFGSWKDELADSMSWAWTQSMAQVLSRMLLVTTTTTASSSNSSSSSSSDNENDPAKEETRDAAEEVDVTNLNLIVDNYELDFHRTIRIVRDDNEPSSLEFQQLDKQRQQSSSSSSSLTDIMDDQLIQLYQSALHQAKPGEYEVRLKTLPYSAEVVSLYTIPYVSRTNLQHNPALKETYRTMLNQPSAERAPHLNKLRKEYLENGTMESTVIAQVLVWCRELFWIKDKVSGNVLLGEELDEPRNIPHLVRMEMTVKSKKSDNGQFTNLTGDWRLTDIDDLLEGNLVL